MPLLPGALKVEKATQTEIEKKWPNSHAKAQQHHTAAGDEAETSMFHTPLNVYHDGDRFTQLRLTPRNYRTNGTKPTACGVKLTDQ